MNKFIFAFLLTFYYFSSPGQKSQWKNELSLSVFKISSQPDFFFFRHPIFPATGIQVIYKNHINDNFNLRLSQSYYKYEFKRTSRICPNCEDVNSIRENNYSAGLEFIYLRSKGKKFNLYSGMDITGFNNFNKHLSHQNPSGTHRMVVNEKIKGIGLQPFTGLNIYPVKNLAISLESSFLLGLSKHEYDFTEWVGFTKPSFTDEGVHSYSQLFLIRTASVGWVF